MAETINPNVVISMPSQLFTLARSFKAAANGKIYIGKIDTDPTIPSNQIQVYLEGEGGSYIPVSQPIIINTGGYPVYGGQISKFVTVEGHSMAVYDAYNVQQFYFPNVLKYDPDQFESRFRAELAESTGSNMIGWRYKNVYSALDRFLSLSDVGYPAAPFGRNTAADALIQSIQEALGDNDIMHRGSIHLSKKSFGAKE